MNNSAQQELATRASMKHPHGQALGGAVSEALYKQNGANLIGAENLTFRQDLPARQRMTDLALRWFRACAVCGAALPPIDLLCDSCWGRCRRLLIDPMVHEVDHYPFPVYSLFRWTPRTEDVVRPLVHGFKQGLSARAAQTFAMLLTSARMASPNPPARVLFVVPPASGGSGSFRKALSGYPLDHAGVLGSCLAQIWRAPLFQGLEPVGHEKLSQPKSAQKLRSAAERSGRRFRVKEQAQQLLQERLQKQLVTGGETTVVFVDDVITTGSTAIAAYMALGDPRRFEVWTIAKRPKLAVHSRI